MGKGKSLPSEAQTLGDRFFETKERRQPSGSEDRFCKFCKVKLRKPSGPRRKVWWEKEVCRRHSKEVKTVEKLVDIP